jgi:hypothetical protein
VYKIIAAFFFSLTKAAWMEKQNKAQRQGIPQWLLRLMHRKQNTQIAASALLEKIEVCQSLEELKALLLSKEVVLDEELMAAFDRRISELEQQTGKSFLF